MAVVMAKTEIRTKATTTSTEVKTFGSLYQENRNYTLNSLNRSQLTLRSETTNSKNNTA